MDDIEDVTRKHLAKLAAQNQQEQERRTAQFDANRKAATVLQLKREELTSRLLDDTLGQALDFVIQNNVPGDYLLRFTSHVRGSWRNRNIVDPNETACWEIARDGIGHKKMVTTNVTVLRSDGKLGRFVETEAELWHPIIQNVSIYSPDTDADKARVLQGLFSRPVFEPVVHQVVESINDLPEFDDQFCKAVLDKPKWSVLGQPDPTEDDDE